MAHAFTIQPAFLMHCVTTCMTVAFEQVLISHDTGVVEATDSEPAVMQACKRSAGFWQEKF